MTQATLFSLPVLQAALYAGAKYIKEIVAKEGTPLFPEQRLMWWADFNNQFQVRLAVEAAKPVDWMSRVGMETLETAAARTAEPINEMMARHKLNVRLDPWPLDNLTIGFGAVIAAESAWLTPGTGEYYVNGKYSFGMPIGEGAMVYNNPSGVPVVKLKTKAGFSVYLIKSGQTLGGFELHDEASQAVTKLSPAPYRGVVLPCWDLPDIQVPEIKQAIGMHLIDQSLFVWQIVQAAMAGLTKMTTREFAFKAGAAFAAKRGFSMESIPDGYYVVDHDVDVAIQDPRIPELLGVMHIPQSEFSTHEVN